MIYFPESESSEGWRKLTDPGHIVEEAKVDPGKLEAAWEYNLESRGMPSTFYPPEQLIDQSATSAVLVLRHGYVVGEWYQNSDSKTRWNIRSCSKSFTGTAFGILFDESELDLSSRAYDYIPDGQPLTDPRTSEITLGHLLSMTSNISGENHGIFLSELYDRGGPFEFSIGKVADTNGRSVAELTGEPGTAFEYSDAAFAHLSLIFAEVAGMELDGFVRERVLEPIGIEDFEWFELGGDGFIGPHTRPGSGVNITSRDLARFGYLMLNGGSWKGRQLVPAEWLRLATRSSQEIDDRYGYSWWVNTHGSMWDAAPRDAFAAMGFAGNKCYVIPSLDLVVVRIADGPMPWNDGPFIEKIIDAML